MKIRPNTTPALPGIPQEGEAPVFAAPWQAQAFAMAMALRDRGVFTWDEWAQRLGAVIASVGGTDTGEHYYEHWLTALEQLVADKQVTSLDELLDRNAAWDRAARATPHGEPIVLGREKA
jgi:nitrile hydratase accessory protein